MLANLENGGTITRGVSVGVLGSAEYQGCTFITRGAFNILSSKHLWLDPNFGTTKKNTMGKNTEKTQVESDQLGKTLDLYL